jgi:hypothetical protein
MDLFDYRPPVVIVHLPVAVWARTVWRETADAFVDWMIKEPDDMERWWRGVNHQVAQDVRRLKVSEAEVQAEVQKARQYVARQVAMLRHAERRTA